MLFTIIVIAVIFAIAFYVAKKTKTTPTSFGNETLVLPSIHEEITKTVEEVKAQAPIVDDVSKTSKAKSAPKMDAKPAKKSATKNK
jgi:hypothetical protein